MWLYKSLVLLKSCNHHCRSCSPHLIRASKQRAAGSMREDPRFCDSKGIILLVLYAVKLLLLVNFLARKFNCSSADEK